MTQGTKKNSVRKIFLACVATVLFCLGTPQAGHCLDVLEVVSPHRFEKFHSFPVKLEVRFSGAARPDTFAAWLNGKEITPEFYKVGNDATAVVGLKDGLRIEVRTGSRRRINVLRTRVKGLRPRDDVDFETFFFVEVDKSATIGSKGGAIQSLDRRLFIRVPAGALPSNRIITLSRVRDAGQIGVAYQLAPRGMTFKRPVTVTMKYTPGDLPPGVLEDDIFLISGDEFPKKPADLVINQTAHTVRATLRSLGKVFMSFYIDIGKKVEDIPLASEFRPPIGDHSHAPYACGNAGESSARGGPAETTLRLPHWSSFAHFDYPRIVLKEQETDTWKVITAFGRNRYVNSASGPTMDGRSFYGEKGAIFNNGEDWRAESGKNENENLPVCAIADGLVIHHGTGYGNAVAVAHRIPAGPIVSVYSHLAEPSPCAVGTVVHKGNVIGKIRPTGAGPADLHYEIVKDWLMKVDADSGEIKAPADWFGRWTRDEVYVHYYDPTDFVLNIMGRYAWDFNVDGANEGWIVKDVEGNERVTGWWVKDGMLSFRPTSRHVQIQSYPLKVVSEGFDSVFIRTRSRARVGRGKLYFATDQEPQYSEDKAVAFEILRDDGFHEYRIFMADHPRWQGTIVGLRIDLLDAVVTETAKIDVHNIRFGRAYLSRTPDTGQTSCYDSSQEIPCPAENAPFYGQDGHYDFSAPSYEIKTMHGQEVVVDRVTGLTWQKDDDGTRRTWTEAVDYCEALTLAGYSDWRLPTRKELQSIVNYGAFGPALDTTSFASSHQTDECYWTATSPTCPEKTAWKVCFRNGRSEAGVHGDVAYVRAVRGRRLEFGQFRDNGDGTITDTTTGLMWQQAEAKAVTWEKALAYCERLDLAGYHDWRLPNIRELLSLVDECRTQPAINTAYFPGCRPSVYWSGTTQARNVGFAWYVDFGQGAVPGGAYKDRRNYVRAVRGK